MRARPPDERRGDQNEDRPLSRLEQLYDLHHRAVLGLAFTFLRDRADAEDVAQEVFLAAWRSEATYSADRGSVRTWLLSMVRHRSIDYLRQRAREARCRQQLERSTPDAYEIAGASIDAADISAINDVLSGVLSLDQQHVVELAYFVGLSQSEVARQLDLPLGTVKSRLRIALSRLRDMCSQSPSGDLIMGRYSCD